MENLKLNKYLINIINEYHILNINNLIEKIPKYRNFRLIRFKPDITLEDIIVKANHEGYKGFFILEEYYHIYEKELNIDMNKNITTIENDGGIHYSFKNDSRDMYHIDIFELDNVFIHTIKQFEN